VTGRNDKVGLFGEGKDDVNMKGKDGIFDQHHVSVFTFYE